MVPMQISSNYLLENKWLKSADIVFPILTTKRHLQIPSYHCW
jgi:hypothetical protein